MTEITKEFSESLLKEIQSDEGWDLSSNDNISIYFKDLYPETGIYALKLHLKSKHKLEELFSIITDTKHRPEYNQQIESLKLLSKGENKLEVILQVVVPPISLISKREYLLERKIEKTKDSFFVIFKSTKMDEVPEEYTGNVRGDMTQAFFVKKLDDESCEFLFFNHTNPQGWVPSYVVNQGQKSMGAMFYENVEKGIQYFKENNIKFTDF